MLRFCRRRFPVEEDPRRWDGPGTITRSSAPPFFLLGELVKVGH